MCGVLHSSCRIRKRQRTTQKKKKTHAHSRDARNGCNNNIINKNSGCGCAGAYNSKCAECRQVLQLTKSAIKAKRYTGKPLTVAYVCVCAAAASASRHINFGNHLHTSIRCTVSDKVMTYDDMYYERIFLAVSTSVPCHRPRVVTFAHHFHLASRWSTDKRCSPDVYRLHFIIITAADTLLLPPLSTRPLPSRSHTAAIRRQEIAMRIRENAIRQERRYRQQYHHRNML